MKVEDVLDIIINGKDGEFESKKDEIQQAINEERERFLKENQEQFADFLLKAPQIYNYFNQEEDDDKNYNTFNKEELFFLNEFWKDNLSRINKCCINTQKEIDNNEECRKQFDEITSLLQQQKFIEVVKIRKKIKDKMLKSLDVKTDRFLSYIDGLIMCWYVGFQYKNFGFFLYFYDMFSLSSIVSEFENMAKKYPLNKNKREKMQKNLMEKNSLLTHIIIYKNEE